MARDLIPDPRSLPVREAIPALVLLDCDDVLLDFLQGFKAFLAQQGLHPDPAGPGCFDMSPWLGLDRRETARLIRRFNDGAQTGFAALPPIPGAVEGVRALRAAGCRLRVISAFSDCEAALARRMENLIRHFGPDAFEAIDAAPLGGSKVEILRRHPASPYVDDLLANVMDAARLAHRPILFKAHHNADAWGAAVTAMPDVSIARAACWPELVSLLGVTPGMCEKPVDNLPYLSP